MTREEAIKELRDASDSEVRYGDTENHYNEVLKRIEALDMAIKVLEQEPILDKIRAEIDKARFVDKDTRICKNALASGLEVAMQIIDKYKVESEGKK